jgi:hypothetical protein
MSANACLVGEKTEQEKEVLKEFVFIFVYFLYPIYESFS